METTLKALRNGESMLDFNLTSTASGSIEDIYCEDRTIEDQLTIGAFIDLNKGLAFSTKERDAQFAWVAASHNDKTTRELPPGLVPISEPYFDGELHEVELIIVDTSKFDDATTLESKQTNKEDESELYKPKVSTWGVFRRLGNISKTFSGGRVICPGEVLESKEEKIVKEAHTKQLLAAYNKKTGLNVDPKLKFEYEEAEKAPTVYVVGDLLVDVGNNNYLSLSIEKVILPHYGIHFPTKKPTRRFSNGKKCCRFNWSVIQSLLYWFFKLSYHKLFTLLQFGGGRVICPGEVLESKEEKVIKEARTKMLLAAYNNKTGLNVDPKLKSECKDTSMATKKLLNIVVDGNSALGPIGPKLFQIIWKRLSG
ncbi:hypothetical protein JHK87_011993 [Glycine soja]|nr:hypothetical protein JHK87_011993 [Glycine soja]